MVVKRECIRDVRVMDERFFLVCSDADYCYRARIAGFEVVYLPVPILHRSGGLTQRPSEEQLERVLRDIKTYKQKWVNGG